MSVVLDNFKDINVRDFPMLSKQIRVWEQDAISGDTFEYLATDSKPFRQIQICGHRLQFGHINEANKQNANSNYHLTISNMIYHILPGNNGNNPG